ncbi:MAG TPA: ABC transporter permease [Armatimonadota bacterium]|jgi:ABC-type polysaccharide/polyol phosphate export permease
MRFASNLAAETRELCRYHELVRNLMVRDLKVRYKNSALGFLWSLLNPLAQVFIITIVFKFVIRIGFPNYSAYVLAGFLPWTFFQMAVLDASQSILLHGPLLKKVYIPREAIPISIVLSNLVHFGLALLVLFVYMAVIRIPFTAKLLLLPPLIFFHLLLTMGIGLLVSCANVFYEDVKYLMTVCLNLMYYMVPVIYVLEQLANIPPRFPWLYAHRDAVLAIYQLNPLAVWITAYRRILLPPVPDVIGHAPLSLPTLAVAALLSVVAAVAGYAVFNRYKWEFAENL